MNDIHESRGYQGRYEWIPTYSLDISRSQLASRPIYDKLGNMAPKTVSWSRSEMVMVPRRNKAGNKADSAVSSQWPLWRANGYLRDNAKDQAARQLYERLANANTLLPLLLKERQSTVDLVVKKVEELIRIKRNFRRRIQHLWDRNDNKAVHNAWLEYRYGWMPTLMDIDALINKPLGLPSLSVRGFGQRINTWSLVSGENHIETYVTYSVLTKTSVIPKDPFMKTASQYGITNAPLILWEALPYSFVADWIFDVGGYLESLGALNGLEVVSPFTSYRTTWSQEVNVPGNLSLYHGYSHWRGSSGSRELGILCYPNPLIPSNGMNLNRFFDSVALLRNLFKK